MFYINAVEKIKTHTLCSIPFSPRKSYPLWMSKMCSQRDHKRRHNMARIRCMLDNLRLNARTRMHTPTHPGTHTLTHTHTHTHRRKYVTIIAFPLQQWLPEHACVTSYAHCPVITRHTSIPNRCRVQTTAARSSRDGALGSVTRLLVGALTVINEYRRSARSQASDAVESNSSVFWVITRR